MSHPTDSVFAAHAKRLALELECLLLDTKDTAALSQWWDSANQALEEYRKATQDAMAEATHDSHDLDRKSIVELAAISRDLGVINPGLPEVR